jgi:hypothetical protein
MKDKFLILDDVISKTYLTYFNDRIFDFDWKFSSNLTYGDHHSYKNSSDLEFGFNAKLTKEQKHFILPLVYQICDLSDIKLEDNNQISRITPRLQTMLSKDNQINDIHVDHEINHYVIIFYPHNIDGQTILYNETTSDLSYSKFNRMSLEERERVTKNFSILKRVDPKENRALVFNGNRYHSSSSPSKGPRCIINMNIDIVNSVQKNLNYQ